MNLSAFEGLELPGQFFLQGIHLTSADLVDPIGRPALAKSVIQGTTIAIFLTPQSKEEESISIYHEVLEALTVAFDSPPESVLEMNEADFEHAAWAAHQNFGFASPENVINFITAYGFHEK